MRDELATHTDSIHAPAGEVPTMSMDIYSTHLVVSADIAGARVIWFLTPSDTMSIGDLVTKVTSSLRTITVETVEDAI